MRFPIQFKIKGHEAGIYPLGIAWHNRTLDYGRIRVIGFQIGFLIFSIWITLKNRSSNSNAIGSKRHVVSEKRSGC